MISMVRLAFVTASIYFAFVGSAFAQYCNTPADIGMASYQVQSVTTVEEGSKFELQVNTISLRCTESYGSYRWQPHNALDPVSRRAMDGSIYTVSVLSAEALLTTEVYAPIQSLVIANQQYQTFVYKFTTREVFNHARFVRLRFFMRFTNEINHEGKIIRPAPTTGSETYIDIRR